jgi:hypothetical protein
MQGNRKRMHENRVGAKKTETGNSYWRQKIGTGGKKTGTRCKETGKGCMKTQSGPRKQRQEAGT